MSGGAKVAQRPDKEDQEAISQQGSAFAALQIAEDSEEDSEQEDEVEMLTLKTSAFAALDIEDDDEDEVPEEEEEEQQQEVVVFAHMSKAEKKILNGKVEQLRNELVLRQEFHRGCLDLLASQAEISKKNEEKEARMRAEFKKDLRTEVR